MLDGWEVHSMQRIQGYNNISCAGTIVISPLKALERGQVRYFTIHLITHSSLKAEQAAAKGLEAIVIRGTRQKLFSISCVDYSSYTYLVM